jgi:hypothetical protein
MTKDQTMTSINLAHIAAELSTLMPYNDAHEKTVHKV